MKRFPTKLFAALLLGTSALGANAYETIKLGETFQPEADTVYEIIPEMNGNLMITVNSSLNFNLINNWGFLLFTEPSHEKADGVKITSYNQISSSLTEINYRNLEAGTPYYFYPTYYAGVDCTFTMTEYTGEGIASVVPSTDAPFNYVSQQEVIINGTISITSIGNATVSYGNTVVDLDPAIYVVDINGGGGTYFIQVKGPEFQKLISEIALGGYDSFTLTVNDVEAGESPVVSNETGEDGVKVEDGTVSATYKVFPAAQYLPEESTWPSIFYSNWSSGNPGGIATLVFSEDIESVGNVTLMMNYFTEGMIKDMDSYELNDYTSVSGNKIMIDFTTEPHLMYGIKQVTVIVQSVIGKNGLRANLAPTSETLKGTLFQHIDYSTEPAPGGGAGLETIGVSEGENAVYDLNGVRVNENGMKTGVYIVNGKKVIVK